MSLLCFSCLYCSNHFVDSSTSGSNADFRQRRNPAVGSFGRSCVPKVHRYLYLFWNASLITPVVDLLVQVVHENPLHYIIRHSHSHHGGPSIKVPRLTLLPCFSRAAACDISFLRRLSQSRHPWRRFPTDNSPILGKGEYPFPKEVMRLEC